MDTNNLDPDLKVAQLVEQYPKTYRVFQQYGCPDMREGFFSLMARIMSIRNAARIHRIPLDNLLEDLEKEIDNEKDYSLEAPSTGNDGARGLRLPADFAEHVANLSNLDRPPETLGEWWKAVFRQFSDNGREVELPDLYRNSPTRHEVHVNGSVQYAGCVMDALMAAVMEKGDPVTVRSIDPESRIPVTLNIGEHSLEVSPKEALICFGSAAKPEDARINGSFADWVLQENKKEVEAALCQHTNAFKNRHSYERWAANNESVSASFPPGEVVELMQTLVHKQ